MIEMNPELIAPCGLYCGVCKLHDATQKNDLALLKRLARVFTRYLPEMASVSADELLCDGCLSERRSIFCRECSIRDCTQTRGLQGCHECLDFPCSFVDEIPLPVGKKVILRAIPYRREHGTEQWIAAEEQRYRCPTCGQKTFRGDKSCSHCKSPVDLD